MTDDDDNDNDDDDDNDDNDDAVWRDDDGVILDDTLASHLERKSKGAAQKICDHWHPSLR